MEFLFYGIKNYKPVALSGRESIRKAYGEARAFMLGQQLSSFWTDWSDNKGTLWESAPVILEFGDFSHELCWMKDEDLQISTNTIDINEGFDLYNFGQPSHWENNILPEFSPFVGKILRSVDLLEAEGQITSQTGWINRFWVPHGIIFNFEDATFCIYNAFDSNRITTSIPTGDEYRRINIW